MLDKLFGWGKKEPAAPRPSIRFGRYSDNNKSVAKTNRWTDADNLFKDKKYQESIEAFFDYLRDDEADNVRFTRREGSPEFSFEIFQGSKIVRGKCNGDHVQAEVSLARMPQPSIPVMRRLLEQNFSLYYSRYSLDGDRLCMRFDSDIETANPNKLYYGLKELATKADKQDDLLVQDFSALQTLDSDHTEALPDSEKEVKYNFMQRSISETLEYIRTLDAEKFSGGIAYLLLGLTFRIDFLIAPEGTLQAELEKIPIIYFAKDEKPATEKNAAMMEAFEKLAAKPKEDFFRNLFRSRSSFAIVAPQGHKSIAEAVSAANSNMIWYRDNFYPLLAQQISEYGLSYCQYSYSMPKVLTQLFELFMQVNYNSYFKELGFPEKYYDPATNKFDQDDIIGRVNDIINHWKQKYPRLEYRTNTLKFDNLTNFNHSFTAEIEFMNFESK